MKFTIRTPLASRRLVLSRISSRRPSAPRRGTWALTANAPGRVDPKLDSVHEKLIELYKSKDRAEWKKLMVLSTRWPDLAEGVFEK